MSPRADGRALEQTRALVVALDVVRASAGSAYVELGDTKVSCAVYGPRQPTRAADASVARGIVDVDVRFAPFANGEDISANDVKPSASSAPTAAESRCADALRRALEAVILTETFAKTQVDVYVTVIDARGSEDAACVLAASAALARAGVECRDVASACACARVPNVGVVLDPTQDEVAQSDGLVFVAQMSRIGGTTTTEVSGRWDAEAASAALDAARAGCHRFDATIRDALRAAASES